MEDIHELANKRLQALVEDFGKRNKEGMQRASIKLAEAFKHSAKALKEFNEAAAKSGVKF